MIKGHWIFDIKAKAKMNPLSANAPLPPYQSLPSFNMLLTIHIF